MKHLLKFSWAILFLLVVIQINSCKKDDDKPEVIASFVYSPDAGNYLQINFTNASSNYTSLSWNFGDGSAASAEENPSHIYPDLGTYTVTLTATGEGGTDAYSVDVTITDPNAELTKLVGETSKTWILLRETTTNRYPLEVGPANHSTIWWAFGLQGDLAGRPCILNDEWTFSREGLAMTFDTKGDYWAEGGVFLPDNICASTDQMLGPNGEDLSAWGDGTHTFELTTGTDPKLKVIGLGAYIGLCKEGNGEEVTVPQEFVEYDIIKLSDDDVDTLIVEGSYLTTDVNNPVGYWRFTLVHYDNPDDTPPIPSPKPIVGFDMVVDGYTITCTSTTQYADTYLWDFSDGTTETTEDVTHTFTSDGYFNISLTCTNAFGSTTATQVLWLDDNSPALTDELLQGAPWRVMVGEKTVFVGPGMGSPDWWAVPKGFLTGDGSGGDDWSCMPDDEFTFSAGGVFTYDGLGSVRNDGYMGTPNGCMDEAALTGNGLFFASGSHTYAFTPAAGDARAIIVLTNGAERAAFLGFYKGYYGGENTDGANPPNGGNLTNQYEVMGYAAGATKEYLFITVDISGVHDGSASWSAILER